MIDFFREKETETSILLFHLFMHWLDDACTWPCPEIEPATLVYWDDTLTWANWPGPMGDPFDLFSLLSPGGSTQLSLLLQRGWLAASNLNLWHTPAGIARVGWYGSGAGATFPSLSTWPYPPQVGCHLSDTSCPALLHSWPVEVCMGPGQPGPTLQSFFRRLWRKTRQPRGEVEQLTGGSRPQGALNL